MTVTKAFAAQPQDSEYAAIVEALEAASRAYRDFANNAMRGHDPHAVYRAMKEAYSLEGRARRIRLHKYV